MGHSDGVECSWKVVMYMAKRWSVGRKAGRKSFSRTAARVHPKNSMFGGGVMRGGYRL